MMYTNNRHRVHACIQLYHKMLNNIYLFLCPFQLSGNFSVSLMETVIVVFSYWPPLFWCWLITEVHSSFKHAIPSLYVGDIVVVDVAYVFWLPPNKRSKRWGPDPERRCWETSLKSPASHKPLLPLPALWWYKQTHTQVHFRNSFRMNVSWHWLEWVESDAS